MGFEPSGTPAYGEAVSKRPTKQTRPSRHKITIRAVKKDPPDLDRFTAAVLALATERVEQQKRQAEVLREKTKLLAAPEQR